MIETFLLNCVDLEMEVNLGIEDILPATVKPDKSLPDSPSDPEDPFDNHIQGRVT